MKVMFEPKQSDNGNIEPESIFSYVKAEFSRPSGLNTQNSDAPT